MATGVLETRGGTISDTERLPWLDLSRDGPHGTRLRKGPAPAALTGVTEIAASEDDQMPLVAYSEDGVVRLRTGTPWEKVDAEGTAPVYPG